MLLESSSCFLAFQTAVVLAEVEGKKKTKRAGKEGGLIAVEPEHIGKTVEMSKDFRDYLKVLNQKNEAELAASRRLRVDRYGPDAAASATAPV